MSEASDPFPAFSHALADMLGSSLKASRARFLEMVTDDVVMEFPYAPPDGVSKVVGRSALTAYLHGVARQLAVDRIEVEVVHHTTEPGVKILEFSGDGQVRINGHPYRQRYISVVRLRDGKISHYRDYWNPLAALGAIDSKTPA